MRLGDAIAHFVVTLRDEHLRSHHTVDLYRRTLIAFAEAVGDLTVSRLGRGHVREHLVQMRDGDANSPATLRTKMAALRAFFNFLLQRGYRRTAPFLPEDFRIRVPRKVAASLTQDELDALLSAVDNGQGTTTRPPRGRASGLSPVLRDRILLFLLAGSGLRVAEATRLDLASIDAERKAIRVHGKGGVEREVFYDVEPLQSFMDEYLIARRKLGLLDGSMFINFRDGKGLSSRGVQMLVKGRELARHFGFKIDPTPPRDPRKKGKVVMRSLTPR
jgi:integrase/recombinase XerC